MKPTIDLNKIGEKVADLYGKGKSDEVISETLSIPECHVKTYRSILRLVHAKRSAFVNPRKMSYNDNTEKFTMSSVQIPFDKAEELGLKKGNSYEMMCYVEKKGIVRIEIVARVD